VLFDSLLQIYALASTLYCYIFIILNKNTKKLYSTKQYHQQLYIAHQNISCNLLRKKTLY
jgi:hypothetical protein